jgi:hypothetical protein
MPKLLPHRFATECTSEFRLSALARREEGEALAAAGLGTGAIYLWGYAVEMTLKAAYFSRLGFGSLDPILISDLRTAIGNSPASTASTLGMTPSGNLHDLAGWGQLIILYRRKYGPAYPSVGFERDVRRRSAYAGNLWSETIRYHKNKAYRYEVEGMRRVTMWILDRSSEL